MKILQLTHKPPYPGIDGGCIAMQRVTESFLRSGHKVDLFSLDTYKHPFDIESFPQNKNLNAVSISINLKNSIVDGLKNLFSNRSYIMERFYDQRVASALEKQLENGYDIIWVESIFWQPYLELLRKANTPVVLRSHNIEHAIWRELAFSSAFPKSWYLRLLSRRLRKEEKKMWEGSDTIFSISSSDSAVISAHTGTPVIDFPMSVAKPGVSEDVIQKNSCFHLGAMDWIPNQEGMRWFLNDVWPGIMSEMNDARFHLAGRRMTPEFKQWKSPGVLVHSKVSDAKAFRSKYGMMAVPLFSGSGLRIKILEALAEGVPVLATSKAVEGMPKLHDTGIFISDDPKEWRRILTTSMHRPEEGLSRRLKGKAYIQNHFSEESLDQILSRQLESLID